MVLAIAICAYTGFLISALIRFPLINTAASSRSLRCVRYFRRYGCH